MAAILKKLAYVPMPDYDEPGTHNYAHDNYFTISQNPDNVSMDWIPTSNGIYLLCQNLNGVVYTGDFRYRSMGIFVATGHADVKMNKINLGVGISFKTQTLPDGRVMPAIESFNVLVDIDRDDINIQIWGNIWSDFAAMFEIFFKSEVVNAIRDSITFVLEDGIPIAVNYEFKKTDGFFHMPILNTWELDWMTPASAIVAPTSLQVGIEGDFFDNVYGETYPPQSIPVMPYQVESLAGFQAFLSDFTTQSFLTSALEEHTMAGWFNATMVPPTESWQLTTGFLNKFLPGLSKTYGSDQPCDIHFTILSIDDYTTSESAQGISLFGDLNLQVWVETTAGTTEKAVELLLT